MKGELITDVNEIIRLADERKSVWCEHWERTCPAIFLVNWRLIDIADLIKLKRVFYYNTVNKPIKTK